ETEKATTEVPAPASGRLKIKVPEGQKVTIDAVVGQIEVGAAAPQAKPDEKKREAAGVTKAEPKANDQRTDKKAPPAPAAQPAPPGVDVLSPPAPRPLAEEQGVNVRQPTAPGRGGRVTKGDVLTHLETEVTNQRSEVKEEKPPPSPPSPAERETRQRMSSIRQ